MNNLLLNGLDVRNELLRHLRLASDYRNKLDAMGKKRNWRYRDILSSFVFHTEEAERLKKDLYGTLD